MESVRNDHNNSKHRHFYDPEWVNVNDLKHGSHYIGTPILNIEENTLNITEEEAFIIGRYIADGHTRKDFRTSEGRINDRHWQLILSVGNHKVNEFKKHISDFHYTCYPHSKSVHRIVFSNKRLVEIVEANCGCGAENKHISMLLLKLPKYLLKLLVEGYMFGDGSEKDGVFKATTISEELIMTLNIAISKSFNVNSSYGYTEREETCVIEERTVNQNDTYNISFRKEMKKQSTAYVDNDIIWLRFKSVTETNLIKKVFNLEVEDDNSYTANNAIVHNCQSFSFSGKRNGMSTIDNIEVLTLDHYIDLKNKGYEFSGQSYLFWEYVRLLKQTNRSTKLTYFYASPVFLIHQPCNH